MSLIKSVQDSLRKMTNPGRVTEEQVKSALARIIDPDLHQDIVSLGFVTKVEIRGAAVAVTIRLTTPACPVKDQMKTQAETFLKEIPGVESVSVEMTAETRGRQVVAGDAKATQPMPSLAGVKNIIAVASGKGGVGKSTTSVNLAYALSGSGAKVGLLDADVYGPSIPLMMDVRQGATAKGNMLVPPSVDGIKVLSIGLFAQGQSKATILRGPMAGNVIKQFLSQVDWGELDYLLIDYPPGTGDIQLTISQTAPLTGAVIVTTPQEVSLIDVRKAVSMFDTLKVPVLGIVETMSYYYCAGERQKHYIFGKGGGEKLAKEIGVPFLAGVPIDPLVVEGGDKGAAVVKSHAESSAAQAFVEASGAMAAQVSILNSKTGDALDQFSLVWK